MSGKVTPVKLERLRQLRKKGVSNRQIARELGVCQQTVCYWVNVLKLPLRKRGKRKFTDEEFLRLYESGLNDAEIARELGVSKKTVLTRRKELGLPPQRNSEKFIKLGGRFAELWLAGKTYREIAESLGISVSTALRWRRRLGLPDAWQRKRMLCYKLYRQGMGFDEIAEKLGVTVEWVRYSVGKVLMELCRASPSCPYKPLLPEYGGGKERVV